MNKIQAIRVLYMEKILTTSLKAIAQDIGLDIQMVEGHLQCTPIDPDNPRYSLDFFLPSMKMVDACRADDYTCFRPFMDAGLLSADQMYRAAERYYLGKTRSGQPIFWMIDDKLTPLDAHILPDTWISTILKRRQPILQYWPFRHCLFGLHLLREDDNCSSLSAHHSIPIGIVESELSAVVLSALFPENRWMAYINSTHLDLELFTPLQGRTVTLFPRTDSTFSTFLFFEDLAADIRQHLDIQITVSSILEDYATDEQKSRCIDLLDFILEDNQRQSS